MNSANRVKRYFFPAQFRNACRYFAAGSAALLSALAVQGCSSPQTYSINEPVARLSGEQDLRISVPNDYSFRSAVTDVYELSFNDDIDYSSVIPGLFGAVGVCTGYVQPQAELTYDGKEIFVIRMATRASYYQGAWSCQPYGKVESENDHQYKILEVYKAVLKTEEGKGYRDYIIHPTTAERLFEYKTGLMTARVDSNWVENALQYLKNHPANMFSLMKSHERSIITSFVPRTGEFEVPYNVATTVSGLQRNPSVHHVNASQDNHFCYTGFFDAYMGYEGKKNTNGKPQTPHVSFRFEVCPYRSTQAIIRLTSGVEVLFSPDSGHVDLRHLDKTIRSVVASASK